MVELFGKGCHYRGDLSLLKRPKVSIVGARRAGEYARSLTYRLAKGFAKRGWVVVSGGAAGIDAMAHRGAGAKNTIVVLPCGIERRYPKINAPLIDEVAKEGLVLSQFAPDFIATPWSFVVRNRLVVELGEFVVIGQADPKSGSMRSAEIAKELGKKIYVFPHRIGESEGTNALAAANEAEVIWDIDAFLERVAPAVAEAPQDPLIGYLKSSPPLDEAVAKYGAKIMELELLGTIKIVRGRVIYEG